MLVCGILFVLFTHNVVGRWGKLDSSGKRILQQNDTEGSETWEFNLDGTGSHTEANRRGSVTGKFHYALKYTLLTLVFTNMTSRDKDDMPLAVEDLTGEPANHRTGYYRFRVVDPKDLYLQQMSADGQVGHDPGTIFRRF